MTVAGAEIAGGVPNPVTSPVSAVTVAEEVGTVEAFNSFRSAKSALGSRVGQDLHHIVEQCQAAAKRSGFPLSRIYSTDNLIFLPEELHDQVSAIYNSNVPGLGMRLRDSSNGQTFEQQLEAGRNLINDLI